MGMGLCVGVVLSAFLVLAAGNAVATCDKSMYDPLTDTAWNGLFPVRVGGVVMAQNENLPDGSSGTRNPICTCTTNKETYIGLEASFWDIGYMIEVVKDAYCSPTLGTSFSNLDNGFHSGTTGRKTAAPLSFSQVHLVTNPLLSAMGILTDMPCLASGNFDISMSEFNPVHSNSFLAVLADPKNLLFANPVADIACGASNALAQLPGRFMPTSYDTLFWCWWGNIYPLSGFQGTPHLLTSAAQNAAREIYLHTELGLLQDTEKNICQPTPVTVPKKSQWRFQLAKPVKTATPFIAGQTELIWGSGKNPPYKDGNFMFIMFQKKRCCVKALGSE